MGLTTYMTRKIPDPFEPDEWILFKMPGWPVLEQAKAERKLEIFRRARVEREAMGAEMLSEVRSYQEQREAKETADKDATDAEPSSTALAKAEPTQEELEAELEEYDKAMLLRCGIKAWSYCEPRRDEAGEVIYRNGYPDTDRSKPIPVNEDTIADLDPLTMKWAGCTLLALVKSGFHTPMPEVERDDQDRVIEVHPTAFDPFRSTSDSIAS